MRLLTLRYLSICEDKNIRRHTKEMYEKDYKMLSHIKERKDAEGVKRTLNSASSLSNCFAL